MPRIHQTTSRGWLEGGSLNHKNVVLSLKMYEHLRCMRESVNTLSEFTSS